MGLKWLITGGCGFIGRNLVKRLVEEGNHYVRIIDNLSVGTRDDLARICDYAEINNVSGSFSSPSGPGVELAPFDILDADTVIKAAEDIDVIVHLAANTGVAPSVENPRMDCEKNVFGSLNCLEAARINKVKRFVFASSGAPAGVCEPPIHEELAPHPVSPYGASKLAGEGYCSAYFHTFGVETVALRFGNVYGPLSRRKDSVVAKFIKSVLVGKPLEIYGDGSQTRDFIFIEDLIAALLLAASVENIGGEVFQIATNSETSVGELAEKMIEVFYHIDHTKKIDIKYLNPRIGDVQRNYSDTSKANHILRWEAETDLKEGLEKTINWFQGR